MSGQEYISAKDLINQINVLHAFKIRPLEDGCEVLVDPSLVGRAVKKYYVKESAKEFQELVDQVIEKSAKESVEWMFKGLKA